MLKTILGVIVGYVVFSISLFVLFSGLYLILGADKSFMPGNFDLTLSWILPSIVVFFVAAALASRSARSSRKTRNQDCIWAQRSL